MSDKVVWILASVEDGRVRYLLSCGCRIVLFLDALALRRTLRGRKTPAPDALVLLADVAANCRVAQTVRSGWVDLILVAWHDQPTGPELAALLSSGVDYVLRPDDSPALLVSVLHALDYRRMRFGADVQPRPFVGPHQTDAGLCIGPWRLMDRGWVLRYKDAATLHLTMSERAVLLCLFEAPGHIAGHADLMAAVVQVWQPRQQARIRDPRCRGIISRLRQRARDAGLPEPPVEPLRGFGYAWAL